MPESIDSQNVNLRFACGGHVGVEFGNEGVATAGGGYASTATFDAQVLQ